jgi:hypothetical protein
MRQLQKNTSMSDELITEREKVVKLTSQLGKSKGDVVFIKYKQQYITLQSKMTSLMQENEVLKNDKCH